MKNYENRKIGIDQTSEKLTDYKIFNCLCRSKPFIYKTKAFGLVYVGLSVCRVCTDEERELYAEFSNKIQEIQSYDDKPKTKIDELVKVLDKILGKEESVSVYTDVQIEETKNKIWNIFVNIDEQELKSILRQHNNFVEALDYKDGAVYRHCKEKYHKNKQEEMQNEEH